jgi:hypothetical protein
MNFIVLINFGEHKKSAENNRCDGKNYSDNERTRVVRSVVLERV